MIYLYFWYEKKHRNIETCKRKMLKKFDDVNGEVGSEWMSEQEQERKRERDKTSDRRAFFGVQ